MPNTARKPNAASALFKELETVRLLADLRTPFSAVPRGTEGTVLLVFGDGAAYQVEFDGADGLPETVPASLLESLDVRAA